MSDKSRDATSPAEVHRLFERLPLLDGEQRRPGQPSDSDGAPLRFTPESDAHRPLVADA